MTTNGGEHGDGGEAEQLTKASNPMSETSGARLLLLAIVLLTGCRTAQSTIEVQAVVGEGEPQVHVVAKVVMP